MALTQVSTGGIKDGQVHTADLADAQITAGKLHADALDHTYTLGADGSNHYTFTGEGLTGAVNDPTLYLIRGKTYRFVNGNSAGAHPFRIQTTVNGSAGTEYNTGVTNNGGAGGSTIVFEVPHNAPDRLYYQCTSHGNMGGVFEIVGATADGGITSAKIANGAVTLDKIASEAVNEPKLQVSNAPVNGYFLQAQSALLGGMKWAVASSPEVYGFNTDSNGHLIVTTTNGGADNIDGATYAAFEDVIFAATGFTFSINTDGKLIATI